MVACQLPKLNARVRFPLPAPLIFFVCIMSVSDFLRGCGYGGVGCVALAGDASTRRYWRVVGRGVLVMADSDARSFGDFLRVAGYLAGLGFSVPEIYEVDEGGGLALIEDFGDATYGRCLDAGVDAGVLYGLAVDVLLALHHHVDAVGVDFGFYDLAVYLDEVDLFSQWFAPKLADGGFDSGVFRGLWAEVLGGVAEVPETLVLRDFHVDNLMYLPGRVGVARCGILDFQDAILGACEYDLVSLLQDARRDLGAGLEAEMLARYIAGAPAYLGGAAAIRQRYALLGAQRHARILGVFVRLAVRDGKAQYLKFMPRVLGQFERALKEAGCDAIADYLDASLPHWRVRGAEVFSGASGGA